MAIARAGNVIGGGDWATDRIIPDLVNAYSNNELPILRYPEAIRPWQHVLDCLNGYLKLIDHMLATGKGGEWNFGPSLDSKHSVGDLSKAVASKYEITGKAWKLEAVLQPHEAGYLLLDSSKSRLELNWNDKLDFTQTIDWTMDWYKSDKNALDVTRLQISDYFNA